MPLKRYFKENVAEYIKKIVHTKPKSTFARFNQVGSRHVNQANDRPDIDKAAMPR
ncbi:hypothetical protein T11_12305 [Trichinella zimbabwensis]|uniref:Uncharacterized protein n=1 Tax=Trichinella zimbabwensis TaxID=268475 RepID=A0A0V1GIU2_9BILA|nr:hypothetical protein T11_12305 [Trichinella zimbabwensis]